MGERPKEREREGCVYLFATLGSQTKKRIKKALGSGRGR